MSCPDPTFSWAGVILARSMQARAVFKALIFIALNKITIRYMFKQNTWLTLAFYVLSATSARPEPSAPDLPEDAETLRKSYNSLAQGITQPVDLKYQTAAASLLKGFEAARQKALQPLILNYKAQLEKLAVIHAKAGRLEEAIEIKKEIESIAPPSKAELAYILLESNDAVSLTSGEWHWLYAGSDKPTQFFEDATWLNQWFKGTWQLKGRKLHLKYTDASGNKLELLMSRARADGPFTSPSVTLAPPPQK